MEVEPLLVDGEPEPGAAGYRGAAAADVWRGRDKIRLEIGEVVSSAGWAAVAGNAGGQAETRERADGALVLRPDDHRHSRALAQPEDAPRLREAGARGLTLTVATAPSSQCRGDMPEADAALVADDRDRPVGGKSPPAVGVVAGDRLLDRAHAGSSRPGSAARACASVQPRLAST